MEISQKEEEQKDHRKKESKEEGEITDQDMIGRDSELMLIEKPNLLLASLKSDSKVSATESASRTLS